MRKLKFLKKTVHKTPTAKEQENEGCDYTINSDTQDESNEQIPPAALRAGEVMNSDSTKEVVSMGGSAESDASEVPTINHNEALDQYEVPEKPTYHGYCIPPVKAVKELLEMDSDVFESDTAVAVNPLLKDHEEEFFGSPLNVIIGKSKAGQSVDLDFSKAPNVLVTGTTGTGKTSLVRCIATEILMKSSPAQVKFFIFDEKKVDYPEFKDIPHLIGPVTDRLDNAIDAVKALNQITEERLSMFQVTGSKNIEQYNMAVLARDGHLNLDGSPALKCLPHIIAIFDDASGLLATGETKSNLLNLMKDSRITGIHSIVVTSVSAGKILTNDLLSLMSARIVFNVVTKSNSVNIIGSQIASRLPVPGGFILSYGGQNQESTMVMLDPDTISLATEYVKQLGIPMYDDRFLNQGEIPIDEDPLYEEIRQYVIDSQKASTSLLQRRFGIGYNRAVRMIDTLEENGIIGPAQGSRPRDVFIRPERKEPDRNKKNKRWFHIFGRNDS